LSDKAVCSKSDTTKPPADPSVTHFTVMLSPAAGAKPESFDIELKNDKVVGLTRLTTDGGRHPLKPRSTEHKPVDPSGCSQGGTLNCWEDEKEAMSICLCISGRPPKGSPQTVVN
jgi:hypothetical protein